MFGFSKTKLLYREIGNREGYFKTIQQEHIKSELKTNQNYFKLFLNNIPSTIII